MIGENEDFTPYICFNSSSKVLLYALFPGKKIFMSNYHPQKSIEPVELTGKAFYKANVLTKVKTKLLKNNNCEPVDSLDMNLVMVAHKTYELW